MFGSTSLAMVEQIRSNHEEIEKLEQLVMAELKTEEPSPMKQLLQGHRLRSMINSIILKTEKLVEMYESKNVEIKDEITPLPDQTNVSSAFVYSLEEILKYHRNHPSVCLVIADDDYEALLKEKEPVIMFSGVQARLEKKQSLVEAKMKKLCNLLDETIKRTKQKGEKKNALAFEKMEKEEAHTESKSGVMGWDGMPIPYWPYKLGLGQEYKCEICRKHYWGKRCFERHFEGWRHKGGLRRLEIQGTEKFNEEAKEVWKRMIPKRQNEETEEDNSSEAPPGVAILPPEIKTMLERSTRFLSKEELEVEERIVAIYGEHASFKFLKSSDPYHAFYQHKLNEYRAQNQDGTQATDSDLATHIQSDARSGYGDSLAAAEFRVRPPILETDKFTCRLPEGITAKELDIIKLTAQFWARFGGGFEKRVKKDPEFEFMKPTDRRFSLFERLVRAYSRVLRPSKMLKEELRKKTADTETVIENCLHRLQWDRFQKKRREKAREKRAKMVRVNERLSPQQVGHLAEMMSRARRPPHPMPKRQKLEESDLVPEDQFLAQHPGWGTMRISIPQAFDAYIEIMVPSLLENVASLKERIALEIPFPAMKQKLSGKTGVLKDNMSLAYYNVGPRDFLTLFLG